MLAIRGGTPARYPPHVSSIESRLVTHMDDWIQLEGAPTPLGLSWIEGQKAFNFALYSKHASAPSLLLYSAEDLLRPLLTGRGESDTTQCTVVPKCVQSVQRESIFW